MPLFGMQPIVRIVGGQKQPFDAVVVGVGDRIELVRVAAGAVDGQPQHVRGTFWIVSKTTWWRMSDVLSSAHR